MYKYTAEIWKSRLPVLIKNTETKPANLTIFQSCIHHSTNELVDGVNKGIPQHIFAG